ncbi:MAG: DUF3667 domain-containing protein [Ignavibacteriales bacterium]|nr:DUF3667 domain-containing protein [Ignavibacteriales bacterium]
MAHHKNKLPECANCGFKFVGADNFCPNCGQENNDLLVPIKHHIHEMFEELLHLDSKSFQTIKKLIFKPGLVSKEFNSGKRASLVAPIRLYIFISFVFFVMISLKPFYEKVIIFPLPHEKNIVSEKEKASLSKVKIDSLTRYRSTVSAKELKGLSAFQIDSLLNEKGMHESQARRLFKKILVKVSDRNEDFIHIIWKNLSYGMFILMPLFAALIFLFYRSQTKFYVESLVISIHYQSFIFLFYTLIFLTDKFFPFEWGKLLGLVLIPVYLFLILKEYYRQSFWKTAGKAFVLGLLHLILLGLFFFGSVLVTLLLL